MFYYVYILQSQKDSSFYIGYTTDLIKRFKQHNNGESQATRSFRPYELIFYEAFPNRIDVKNMVYLKASVERAELLKKLLPKGMSLPELALRFILSNPDVSTTIPGMRKVKNVEANLKASGKWPLSSKFIKELRVYRWDRKPVPSAG